MDWTYDLYMDDVVRYGVEDEDSNDYRAYFIARVKRDVEEFLSKWKNDHDGRLYAPGVGWAGDEFIREADWGWFSDFYKDAYNQRPHLPTWFYLRPLGLPMREDTMRTFCASPVEEACEMAREARRRFAEEG